MRFALHAVLLLVAMLVPSTAAPCSPLSLDRNSLVENDKFTSENGDFVLVLRRYPALGDFEAAPLGELLGPENEDRLPSDYSPFEEMLDPELHDDSTSVELSHDREAIDVEFEYVLHDQEDAGIVGSFRTGEVLDFLVGNDGLFMVAIPTAPCGRPSRTGRISIFDRSGLRTSFTLADVLSENDLAWHGVVRFEYAIDPVRPHLLTISPRRRTGEPRAAIIDLWSAARIDEGFDLLPRASRIDIELSIDGAAVDRDSIHLDAPVYPLLALKARVGGDVIVDLEIDEAGHVVATDVRKGLPFGISQAAVDAISSWRLPPAMFHTAGKTAARARLTFFAYPED